MEKEKVEYEITGMRSWIAAECGVPEADVRGFRCPYLTTAPATRQVRGRGEAGGWGHGGGRGPRAKLPWH